jgi:hypothetical protein
MSAQPCPLFKKRTFDPTILLYKALSYGEAVWHHIQHQQHNITPLVNLTYIIEDHLQNLIDVYTSNDEHHNTSDPSIKSLITFYSSPELLPLKHHLIHSPLVTLIQSNLSKPSITNSNNYFYPLYSTELERRSSPSTITMTNPSSQNSIPSQASKSFYVEDLAVSEVSDIVRLQMDQDRQHIEETTTMHPHETQTQNREVQASQRLRINLFRHRFARSSDMTTLKLFKSFVAALRSSDKDLTILPFDLKKQQYTSVVSNKQLEKLNDHELKLYFQPWHQEQHYSLSGFFHLNSTNHFQELFNQAPVAQWLDTYQYSIKLCPSQTEEMAVIGALCYGSLWICREDLKMHIMHHQAWLEANTDMDNPIVFDLIVRQFRGSKKSTQMIFVTAERSKQDIVHDIFKTIYDGTPKAYPRGEMMLFIPTKKW